MNMVQDVAKEQQMKDMSNRRQIMTKHRQMLNANHTKSISCLYMFGNYIYIGTRLAKVLIYEYDNFNPNNFALIVPHFQVVISVTAQNRYFIVVPEADDDNDMSVYNVKDRTFSANLKGHKSQVSGVIFLTDQNYLATCSWDGTVRVWHIKEIHQATSFQISAEYPVLVIEEINAQMIAFGGDDCYVTIYNWKKKQQVTKAFGHAGSVTFLHASLPFIMTGGGDQKLKVWDFKRKQSEMAFDMRDEIVEEPHQVEDPDKLKLQMSRQIKKFYDSSIFMTVLEDKKQFLFIDRHGERFIFRFSGSNVEIISGDNNFLYHDNITGVVRPSKTTILVATAKGDLTEYKISSKTIQSGEKIKMQKE